MIDIYRASIPELNDIIKQCQELKKQQKKKLFHKCRRMQHEMSLQNTQVASLIGVKKSVYQLALATGEWNLAEAKLIQLHDVLWKRAKELGFDESDFR